MPASSSQIYDHPKHTFRTIVLTAQIFHGLSSPERHWASMPLLFFSSHSLVIPYAFKLQLIKIEGFCFVYPFQILSWKHHGFTFNVRATIWTGDCNPVGSQISNFLIPRENPTENRCRVSSLEGYRSRHVWTWRSAVSASRVSPFL